MIIFLNQIQGKQFQYKEIKFKLENNMLNNNNNINNNTNIS